MAGTVVILGLFAIIVIHELGHFLAAKAVGIRATKFYLFFPPALVRRTIGDVEYGIGTIPLGGFVKLPGMYRPRARDVHWRIDNAVREIGAARGRPEDALRLAAAVEAVRGAADPDQLAVAVRSLDAELAELNPAGGGVDRRVARVRGVLAGALDDCHERAYWRASLWRRMAVILAGPAANVVLAFAVMVIATMFFVPRYAQEWRVSNVLKDSPAEQVGLRKHDVVETWNGHAAKGDYRAFRDVVADTRGKQLTLVVTRKGERRTFTMHPKKIGDERLVGVTIGYLPDSAKRLPGYYRIGAREATHVTLRMMQGVTTGVFGGIGQLARGKGVDDVTTVVGFVQVAPEIEKAGQLPGFIAMISLIIAIMNMLPLLPLDGGHVAFGFVEMLRRGRPLPRDAFERFSVVGLTLIVGLFLIGLGNDLGFRD